MPGSGRFFAVDGSLPDRPNGRPDQRTARAGIPGRRILNSLYGIIQ